MECISEFVFTTWPGNEAIPATNSFIKLVTGNSGNSGNCGNRRLVFC